MVPPKRISYEENSSRGIFFLSSYTKQLIWHLRWSKHHATQCIKHRKTNETGNKIKQTEDNFPLENDEVLLICSVRHWNLIDFGNGHYRWTNLSKTLPNWIPKAWRKIPFPFFVENKSIFFPKDHENKRKKKKQFRLMVKRNLWTFLRKMSFQWSWLLANLSPEMCMLIRTETSHKPHKWSSRIPMVRRKNQENLTHKAT